MTLTERQVSEIRLFECNAWHIHKMMFVVKENTQNKFDNHISELSEKLRKIAKPKHKHLYDVFDFYQVIYF